MRNIQYYLADLLNHLIYSQIAIIKDIELILLSILVIYVFLLEYTSFSLIKSFLQKFLCSHVSFSDRLKHTIIEISNKKDNNICFNIYGYLLEINFIDYMKVID